MSAYTYQYPHPAVTTDCCIFAFLNNELSVLLIKRGVEPFKGCWALPGGFMRMDESAEQCALRELQEETGYTPIESLRQFHTYSSPERDPRERVVTVAFYALVKMGAVCGGDDADEARWFAVASLPELAFDHSVIVNDALMAMRRDIYFEPIGFELLPPTFSMAELQKIIETITGDSYDRRNFYNKMRHTQFVQEVTVDDRLVNMHYAQQWDWDCDADGAIPCERKRRSGVRYFFNSIAFKSRKDKKGSGPITY